MIMRWIFLALAALASVSAAHANELLNIEKAAFVSFATFTVPPINPTFAPLHTYYMSPTSSPPSGWSIGSDGNNGTSQSTPWATPNHAVVCGDVIIAAPGAYAAQDTWGAVSTCPSTTGGLSASPGGVYFATLLCGGTYVGACAVTGTLNGTGGVEVNASNWAVEGWQVSEGYTCSQAGFGFEIDTQSSAIKYTAFINDIANHNASGFGVNAHGPAGDGADYFAFVGDIAQDSAGRCDSGVSTGAMVLIGVANADTNAGTHILVQGNYSINNQQTLGASDKSDGECYLMDTLDYPSPGYSQQIVFRDNMSSICERYGLQIFYQAYSSNPIPIKVYNNTFTASNQMAFSALTGINDQGDINVQSANNGGSGLALPWLVSINNNIIEENLATSAGGDAQIFAIMNGGSSSAEPVIGGSGLQNVLHGLFTGSCPATCDTGNATKSIAAYSPGVIGTNTYEDPLLNNLADAIANRIGTPNCTGFSNTAACMGVNFGSTPTNPSFVYDLTATSAHSPGNGYQPPANCVGSDPDYPTWLKGVVYLQWNGTTITENAGLITKPCGV